MPSTRDARWRILITPAADGRHNMALDEALMRRAGATGETVLRLYGWCAPTLSLGRNQPARDRYDTERAAELGVTIVRRLTGGRAVLHHREVTYSVTAPAGALGRPRESYAAINRLLLGGLSRLGIRATEAAPRERAAPPGVAPCFSKPAAGEIIVDGRKLVGSAQVHEHGVLLQHGSVLIDNDQALATSLLVTPAEAPPPAATLHELLGRAPTLDEVAAAIGAALESMAGTVKPLALDAALLAASRTACTRYRDEAWTWRC